MILIRDVLIVPPPGEMPFYGWVTVEGGKIAAADVMAPVVEKKETSAFNHESMGLCLRGTGWLRRAQARAETVTEPKIQHYRASRDAYRGSVDYLELAAKDPALDLAPHNLVVSLAALAGVQSSLGRVDPSEDGVYATLPISQRSIDVAELAYSRCGGSARCTDPDAIGDLALRNGIHAWYLIRAAQAEEAPARAETAIKINREDVRRPRNLDELAIAVNLAHGKLFTGDFNGARELYLALKDIAVGGTTGKDETISDFADLRDLKVTIPAMCHIGQLIGDPAYTAQTCPPL